MTLSQLDRLPRVPLGQLPTPLEPLAALNHLLGGPRLWVKRDDALGPGTGGNKTRKLEYLFGDALSRRARGVATFGGLQSNFARQMAAVAPRLGLKAHCFYFERRPGRLAGNLLLVQLLGAQLHFVPFGSNDNSSLSLEQATRLVRWVVRLTPGCIGRRVYFMPVGGHSPIGALGYVRAALELEAQLADQGIAAATIVTAAGSGGTLAGLLAGFEMLGSQHRVLGIDVGRLWKGFRESIAVLASSTCARLGRNRTFDAAAIPLIEDQYVGDGYARVTAEALQAIRVLASRQGLLLDPVYTSKAMAGLIDQIRQGRWSGADHVVFLHTGGVPALWAYESALAATSASKDAQPSAGQAQG